MGVGVIGRVLKVDLWNESVDVQRDILGQLQGGEQFGLDISELQCQSAHNRLSDVKILQGDIRYLPYADSTFNTLLDISTLDHIPTFEAIGAINEYQRVLQAGGVLVLMFAPEHGFAVQYWNGCLDGVCLLDADTVMDAVKSGFVVVKDVGFDLLPFVFAVLPRRLVEKMLWHLPKKLQKMALTMLGFCEIRFLGRVTKRVCGLRLVVAVKKHV